MKTLHLTLIALFVLTAAKAQTIAEADLLGEWHLTKIYIEGSVYDIEKGEADYSEKSLARLKQEGVDPETDIAGIMKNMGGIRFIFKPGFKVDFGPEGRSREMVYTIAEKDGSTFISMGGKRDMKAAIVNGFLQLTIPFTDGDLNMMEYKKIN